MLTTVGHVVSWANTQLCHYSRKETTGNMLKMDIEVFNNTLFPKKESIYSFTLPVVVRP